jgi:hypothetical protein
MRSPRFKSVAGVAAALTLLTATVALADNVQNDVTGPGVVTVDVGEVATVGFRVQASGGDTGDVASDNCNPERSAVTITFVSAPAGVIIDNGESPSSNTLTFETCGSYQDLDFSSDTEGTYEITASVPTGVSGYNTNPAKFTLIVEAADPVDTTPPTWECDPSSADAVWHADNQTHSCTAEDPSGLADPTLSSFTLQTTVGEGEETSNASTGAQQLCDTSGNCTTAGPIAGWMIDRKAPTAITFDGAPSSVILGSTFPTVTCDAEDDGSGLDDCVVTGQDTSTVGPKQLTATATDNVGNQSTATHNYNVVYDFDGFFRPIDMGVWNVAKAGSAIPVKFSLGGNQGLQIFAAGYPKSVVKACDATGLVDAVEETLTAGNSSLTYDPYTDTYTYVWKTDKAWAKSCRQLTVMLNDGTSHTADFHFTK